MKMDGSVTVEQIFSLFSVFAVYFWQNWWPWWPRPLCAAK